ncbi:MAG: PIN domain-containing protein [Oribacterium sp.]|nr:PIN domain-containing protein [Oribacterium sp.]
MKAVMDTCIIIDALQNRQPFCEDAQKIFLLCANDEFEGFLTAKAITDIYYLTHRQLHNDKATREIIVKLCKLFSIVDTSSLDVINALSSEVSDFEDAVMIESAVRYGVDCIVTRNMKDYSKSSIPVFAPEEFISLLINRDEE